MVFWAGFFETRTMRSCDTLEAGNEPIEPFATHGSKDPIELFHFRENPPLFS